MARPSSAPKVTPLGVENEHITLDSPEWYKWLSTVRSFRFEVNNTTVAGTYSFTAVLTGAEKNQYWNAQKRVEGKLRSIHLGKTHELTQALLEQTARIISTNLYCERRSLKTPPSESCEKAADYKITDQDPAQVSSEIIKLRAEVERLSKRESYLLDQLGLVKSQIIHEAQERVKELENQVSKLDNHNWELEKRYDTLNDLWRKSEQKRHELQAELKKIKVVDRSRLRISSKTNDYYQLRGEAVVFLSDLEQMDFTIEA